MPLADAYRAAHAPKDEAEARRARERLAFDELLLLQLGVMMRRHHLRERLRAPALRWDDEIDARIRERFPFPLTSAQSTVIREIASDIAREGPMNRLLQGDVGAGKTVVALYGMLQATATGHQACLMAPTELLAEQHLASIRRMLVDSDVEIVLLTGGLPAAVRRERLERIASGEVDIVVGTHALLTESVRFKSLALAVVDEQHRFGVVQRAALREKSASEDLVPHVLVMTATPIPRTLSLTLFGDLDVSVIDERLPGRSPVVTRVVGEDKRDDVYGYVAERLAKGEQAYVVVPAIDESDAGLADVHSHLERLASGALSGCTIEPMHGRLDAAERDAAMQRFRDGTTQCLVATVVIEVGVDVPNATVMVVEHAERFGLAQLHQLRGRVGRGNLRGVCALIGTPTTDDATRRLEAIASTEDGFAIAELDLGIRGPGELFGARQSGLPPFKVADLVRDIDLLNQARTDAAAWIERSPELKAPEEALLRRKLMLVYGEALGIGDVG
jgi:ATP-dependent DNA helicase RecG